MSVTELVHIKLKIQYLIKDASTKTSYEMKVQQTMFCQEILEFFYPTDFQKLSIKVFLKKIGGILCNECNDALLQLPQMNQAT